MPRKVFVVSSIRLNALPRLAIQMLLCVALGGYTACERGISVEEGIKIERESIFCNVREYRKSNITFYSSSPIQNGNNYYRLLVGTLRHPYNGEPPLVIRLPDGQEMNLTETSIVSQLRTQMSSVTPVGGTLLHREVDSPDARWPEGTERLQRQSWVFYVLNEQILSFGIYYRDVAWEKWTGQKPAIGTGKSGVLYEFPLSQREVIDVFGKPDKIREYFEE